MEPLISVIIPVYKVEPYLRRCIDSVLAQTYTNLEVILVDDGSPDNCGSICDSYAAIDSRVKVIHQKNGGLSCARNSGLDLATGDYIAFVDSDDIIDTEMYAVLYSAMQQAEADISICGFVRFDLEENIRPSHGSAICCSTNLETLYDYFNEKYVQTVVCWNKLFRRHLFDDIRFASGRVHEDEFIMHQLIYRAKSIVRVENDLYYYRINANSQSHEPFSARELDAINALEERIEFYNENGLAELADMTHRLYVRSLMEYYFQAKDNCKTQDCVKSLRKAFLDQYRCALDNPFFSPSRKIGLRLFKFSPLAYQIVRGIYRRVSRESLAVEKQHGW